MKIAVAGGTGTVGRHVVAAARDRGHDVIVLTRAEGVDVTTGEGLSTALVGADAVIDVTNAMVADDAAAAVGAVQADGGVLNRPITETGELSVGRFPITECLQCNPQIVFRHGPVESSRNRLFTTETNADRRRTNAGLALECGA